MAGKISEKNNMASFAQMLAADSCCLPLAVFRDYREWGLSDRELGPLVRVIAPALRNGSVSVAEIAAEFDCPTDKAQNIAQYFVARHMLEYDAEADVYTCRILLGALAEKWLTGRRLEQSVQSGKKAAAAPSADASESDDRELLQKQSHLYRCFERDFGRNLRYSESDRLRSWLEDEQFDSELIEEALRRASLQNKCSFAYIGSILERWKAQGLHTLADVLVNDSKPSAGGSGEDEPVRQRKPREKKESKTSKFSDVTDDLL